MDFSIFTIFTSFIWVNIFMFFTILLRRKRGSYKYFSVYVFLLLIVLSILKAFFIVEFPFTFNINSTEIMIKLLEIFAYPVFLFDIKNLIFTICIGEVFIVFSLLVSIIIVFVKFYNYNKFHIFINSLPRTINDNMDKILLEIQKITNFNRKIKVVIHKGVKSPAIIGYFKPIIILPQLDFIDNELKGIFIHEIMHNKSKHIIIKLIIEFIKVLFWWNPLVYLFSREVNNILEFHADKKLSLLLNKEEKTCYLSGISKVINNFNNQKDLPSTISGLSINDDKNIIVQRFVMFVENIYEEKPKLINKITILLSLLMFLISYMFVIQPYGKPTEENYNDDAPIITKDCYIIKTKNSYMLYDKNGNPIKIVTSEDIDKRLGYLEIREENQ